MLGGATMTPDPLACATNRIDGLGQCLELRSDRKAAAAVIVGNHLFFPVGGNDDGCSWLIGRPARASVWLESIPILQAEEVDGSNLVSECVEFRRMDLGGMEPGLVHELVADIFDLAISRQLDLVNGAGAEAA